MSPSYSIQLPTKTMFGVTLWSFLVFWGHFGSSGTTLGSFWQHFGTIFDRFEVLLGPIWGPLGFFGSFSALWGLFRTILGHSGHVWDHFWSFEVILGPFLGSFGVILESFPALLVILGAFIKTRAFRVGPGRPKPALAPLWSSSI